MEVMDNTVIQNNYPKAKKRVKWAIFLYIKQDKIMVSILLYTKAILLNSIAF